MKEDKDELLVFNGIDGTTGDYLQPPLRPAELLALVRGEKPAAAEQLLELKHRHREGSRPVLGPMEGVDPKDLAQAGWGVVFARDADPAIRESLGELLEHRRTQATRLREGRYQEYAGERGLRPGESKVDFLTRHGAGPGPVDPDQVPYYLLIVGSPAEVPFDFQYQLDVQHAVGRLSFDHPEGYAAYARSVVEAEGAAGKRTRRFCLFGVANPDDRATRVSHDQLILPLAEALARHGSCGNVEAVLGEAATKARLLELLGGPETPSLLLTASHGVSFPCGHRRQLTCQGALLCQDWPGPREGRGKVSREVYVCADDIAEGAPPRGLLAFHFACYGAGTPRRSDFTPGADAIAPHGFLAALPCRLLGHPRGGALAVVGHVDRAWGYSFTWRGAGRQLQTFESTFRRLTDGHPVGSAMEYFNQRYAELACEVAAELAAVRSFNKRTDEKGLSGLWTAHNDARNFVVLGDPAVRLPAAPGAPVETVP